LQQMRSVPQRALEISQFTVGDLLDPPEPQWRS
jgi:hypothetical protein